VSTRGVEYLPTSHRLCNGSAWSSRRFATGGRHRASILAAKPSERRERRNGTRFDPVPCFIRLKAQDERLIRRSETRCVPVRSA
jgi:hypothetical protein